jgi:hypothetical protein
MNGGEADEEALRKRGSTTRFFTFTFINVQALDMRDKYLR